ncbi:MAG: proteasome subunit alpha [Fimbriimonadaceae bacterium]
MIDVQTKTFAELVSFDASNMGVSAHDTHATTVLALRFKDGVLMLADRRATMGNLIMFDHAEKVFELDDEMLIAISGSFAKSVEVCRFLKHSFKYYRRVTLNELSVKGKLQEISRTLAQNAPAAMQGIGLFIPIVAAYDRETGDFSVHFFDAAGAVFQNGAYACAGSGSERIRGVFEYIARTQGPWESKTLKATLKEGLQMLEIAADLDSATGGFSKVLPVAKVLTAKGVDLASDEELAESIKTLSR